MKKSEQKIRVLVIDDNELFREGLPHVLSREKKISVVGAVAKKNIPSLIKQLHPDIVLMDPGKGGEGLEEIAEHIPSVRFIILSQDENLLIDSLKAGATGYITKGTGEKDILLSVRQVYRSHPFFCKMAGQKLITLVSKGLFTYIEKSEMHNKLRPVERQIIQWLCEEKTSLEISGILGISIRTVEQHRAHILDKTKAKSTIGIVLYAIRHSLFKLQTA